MFGWWSTVHGRQSIVRDADNYRLWTVDHRLPHASLVAFVHQQIVAIGTIHG